METTWSLDPPPGFQGLREDLPLRVYRRNLPHWRQDGATYFVTFRLADSLPQSKLHELDALRAEWKSRPSDDEETAPDDELTRETMRRVEKCLDQGMGECVLGNPSIAKSVVEAMLHYDVVQYELACHVVMPNHVHALVRPCSSYELEDVLHGWKRCAAIEVNRALGRQGTLWQGESFDRIVRDEEHLWRVIRYIGRNPRMAGLDPQRCQAWIRPSWAELGWDFDASDGAGRTGRNPSYPPRTEGDP